MTKQQTGETDKIEGKEHFISHLIELRNRLLKSALGVILMCAILLCWPGPARIYDFLAQPMLASLPAGAKMIATGVLAPFLVPMKLTLLVAFVLALPWVLYQLWAFIAPGLYLREKKIILPLVISSSLLFLAGIAFSYFFVFGRVFHFINTTAPSAITVAPDIENYLDFVMTMCLAFGTAFEVPIVVILLARMGIVTIEQLKSARRYIIVAAFIIAAIVTPPDIISQFALAIPMCLLYELGLWVTPMFLRKEERGIGE
jgi:sec-independent protein translocase protein TatC